MTLRRPGCPIQRSVFADHSPDNGIPIGLTFCDWIFVVIQETEENGTTLHPMDYSLHDKNGSCKSVYLKRT